eukprot:m.44181 g.44181  ORF g.44181 m.44181 type:complete len:273 (+) comp10064_c0_seq1:246-1064(+)
MDDLLSSFMAMGTTDKDTLVQQFTTVIPSCDVHAAEFFLEANNWNLAAAVGSYMDQGGSFGIFQTEQLPRAEFICDVTIGEGEEIPPGAEFTKTWRLRNTGDIPWPHGSVLVYIQGDRMGGPEFVSVESLAPGQVSDISVQLRAPRKVGTYAASWRLRDERSYFSEEIWIVITVAEGGLLTALQGMHGANLGSQPQNVFAPGGANPFGVPFASGPSVTPAPTIQPPAVDPASGRFTVPNFGSLGSQGFGQVSFNTQAPSTQTNSTENDQKME